MAAHTPGPWYQDRNSYVASEIGTIARVYAGGRAATTQEGRLAEAANAALIAAAPELLAEAIADDGLAVFIERTLAAVALPSGQPEVARAFADIRGALASRGALRRAAIAKAEGRQ